MALLLDNTMDKNTIKVLLSTVHINGWNKIYRDNKEVRDYLCSTYNYIPHTDKDIFKLFYCINNNLDSFPRAYCGDVAKFEKYNKGFKNFCVKYDRKLKENSCPICHTKLYEERGKKSKVTNLEKYGTEICQQSNVVKNKVKKTNLERYGVESHNQSEEIKDKKKKAIIEKYGVENISQIQEVKEKKRNTTLKNHNVYSFLSSPDIKLHRLKTRYDNILSLSNGNYTLLFEHDDLLNKTPFDLFPFMCNHCSKINWLNYNTRLSVCSCLKKSAISNAEKELFNYIQSLTDDEVLENVRNIISPKELDIYIPSKKLAIEFNGNYWHSSNYVTKEHHQVKTLLCKDKDIKLIHIFEDEWKHNSEIIKERLKSALGLSTTIYARKTQIRLVSKNDSEQFLNKYHIQGSCSSSVNIGLYYENVLYALMTFGKSRFNKDYEWELIRYCSNSTVVGGASKLLKYFERNYNPSSLISYADMNWSDGKLYNTIGFTNNGMTEPGYFYYDPVNEVRISRQKCQKYKLVKLGYDSNKTETEICTNDLGYYKIYDAGNLIFSKKY